MNIEAWSRKPRWGRSIVVIGALVLVLGAAGCSESASEKCNKDHGAGSPQCLEAAEDELKEAEYGNVEKAEEAEHDEEVESELSEAEHSVRQREIQEALEGKQG